MKALVHANRTLYFKAITKAEKRIITTDLTEEILKKGRFLKAEGKQWCIVPFECARQKIAHAIQYRQRCFGQVKREHSVMKDFPAIEKDIEDKERSMICFENSKLSEQVTPLLSSSCDGNFDKLTGLASSTEGFLSSDLSISNFDSSDCPAVSWSRAIALLQESTNIQFSDAEIPSPLQSLLRSTSDFSFGDCSLFGHSVLVTGKEIDFDIF